MLALVSTNIDAQESTDIVGEWNGSYSFLGKNYPLSYQITLENDELLCRVRAESIDSAHYIIYTAKGKIENSLITFSGDQVIEKSYSTGCMSLAKLHFTDKSGYQLLEGKWKPYFHKDGCPIGASGNISLVKSKVTNKVILEKEDTVISKDEYTLQMIEGLKKRRFHALIIAENKYEDDHIPSLDQPIEDARKLSAVLREKYNFKEENIQLLEDATRTEIVEAFEKLDTLNNYDNLLIFYAGHGYWDEKLEQGYWMPIDASKNSRANWISNSTIRDYIKGIESKHTLLIADACFSGGLLKTRSVGKSVFGLYNLPSRKAMTSGTLTTVPDKSVFLDYLVNYLKNNKEALISADELFYSIKVDVINNSPQSQIPQYGPIQNANDEGGEFLFLNKNAY